MELKNDLNAYLNGGVELKWTACSRAEKRELSVLVNHCLERLIRHFTFTYSGLNWCNMGIWCKSSHTHTRTSIPSLIYAQRHSQKTTSDIGGPLQKHVSWSDLWLVYGALVADCSDVGLIHQCQQTQRRHTHTNTTTHTHKHREDTHTTTHTHKHTKGRQYIFLISIELFCLSVLLPSQGCQRSGSHVDQHLH